MTRGVRSPTQNRSVGVDPSHQNSSTPRRKQQTVRAGHWTEIRVKSRIYVQQLRPARGASSCGEEQEHTQTYRDPVLAAGRVVHLAVPHSHTLAAILGGRVPAAHATRNQRNVGAQLHNLDCAPRNTHDCCWVSASHGRQLHDAMCARARKGTRMSPSVYNCKDDREACSQGSSNIFLRRLSSYLSVIGHDATGNTSRAGT